MIAKMTSRLTVALALLVSLVATSVSVEAARPKSAYDGAGTVSRVASLVENEFLETVPSARLVGGALKGLREYLQRNGYKFSMVPQAGTRMTTFRKAWNDATAANPKADQKQMAFASVRTMLDTLDDPYTVFLDPEEYKGLMGQLNGGNFGGLGIYIELDDKNDKALTIVEPMDGTPAEKAGLKPRDIILEIGGKSTRNMPLEEATRLLRGPVGSTVVLTIQRPGTPEPLKVPLVRAIIHVKTLSYKVLDGKVGYIKLRVFGENVNEEMEEAFRAFDQAGVKAYVLDLRNNGGGYITAALDVSSKFLPTGSRVVSVAERGSPEIVYNSRPNMRDKLPVVILVNKYSASASEITAGAMKDLQSGTLMGEKTFGKGSVQKIFPLPDGSAVKVTTAHYRTPNGSDIHKKGIQPDVAISMRLEDVGSEDKDVQLKAALDLLKARVAQNDDRLAANPGVVVGDGVIRVASAADEFEYIGKLRCDDGGRFLVESQKMVNEGGQYFDEVVIKCERGGERRTLRFQVDFFAK